MPPGTLPAEQQRGVEPGIDQPREQADPGQPTGRPEDGMIGPARPLCEREPAEWLLDQAEVQGLARRRRLRREDRRIELAVRSEEPGMALLRAHEQVAFRDVWLDGGREEQLTGRVADDRLVGAQELEIGRHSPSAPRGVGADGPGSPRPNAARTAGWFR